MSGFITPSPQTVTLAWGDTLAATGADYTELATVTVQLTGSGAGGRTFSVTPRRRAP